MLTNYVNVSAPVYAAALAFAAVGDIRWYLNGVKVEPSPDGKGVILIATDGHALICLSDPEGECTAPVILPRVKLTAKQKREGERVKFDGTACNFGDGSTMPAAYVDGSFPDWHRIVPQAPDKKTPIRPAFIDTKFLARLESARDAYPCKWHSARIAYTGPDRSAFVTFGHGLAFAVIMPIRDGGDAAPFAMPDFMTVPAPKKAKVRTVAEVAADVAELEPETVYPEAIAA